MQLIDHAAQMSLKRCSKITLVAISPQRVHCTSQIIVLRNVDCCSSYAQAVSLSTQL
jgi:hypothetical protein